MTHEPILGQGQAGAEASPAVEALIERQLLAFNAHDVAGLLDCYSPDGEQILLEGSEATVLARGHAALAARFAQRFGEARPRAQLLSRHVAGPLVLDHECLHQWSQGQAVRVELWVLYEVVQGRIRRSWLRRGPEQRA